MVSRRETDTNNAEEDGALWAPNPPGKIEEVRRKEVTGGMKGTRVNSRTKNKRDRDERRDLIHRMKNTREKTSDSKRAEKSRESSSYVERIRFCDQAYDFTWYNLRQ